MRLEPESFVTRPGPQHRARLDDASADAFEGALREDDRVRDERLEAADRLAKMRIEETAIAAEDASIEAIGREIGGRSSALGAVGQEMMPVIAAAGLPAEFEAEDLVGWLERAERLRDTIGDRSRSSRQTGCGGGRLRDAKRLAYRGVDVAWSANARQTRL